MTLPAPDNQLILLPARTAQEASLWGAAAMEYAAKFGPIEFSRDPERVDWRAYQHVTIIRPKFWPENLPLIIKQANPEAIIDRIPAEVPAALKIVFNVRVYYGWRYGPQSEYQWAQLWPPGKCLIGLHGRADGAFQEADYPIVRRARVEAIKITSHATPETVKRLRAINPDMFFLVRLFTAGSTEGRPNVVTPDGFVFDAVYTLSPLLETGARIEYLEVHNEPNLAIEGLGGYWHDGEQFGNWFLEVVEKLRGHFPDARLGFPGLSPGSTSSAQGRMDSELFLSQAEFAAQQADWIGMHAYWVNEKEMADRDLGFNFISYRERFPEKLLFLTEFGNPRQSRAVVAEQYARYYGILRHVNGLGAAFAYILSTSDPTESALWAWRDEQGNDLGLAGVVGEREYIR